MISFIIQEWKVLLTFLIILTVIFSGSYYFSSKLESENDRLLVQCMDDGKKEYECVSMLRRNRDTVVPIPIPIIMPR